MKHHQYIAKGKVDVFSRLLNTFSKSDTHGWKNESSFGLPSCYCATCDPRQTIGKVYNGLCYFVTLDDEFLLRYTYMEQHQVIKSSYSPPLLQSPQEELLLIAIANELYASKRDLIIDPLRIVYYNGSHNESHKYQFPTLTINDGRYWIDKDDGMSPTIGVLMARPGFFTVIPPFVPPVSKQCTFDINAAQYQDNWCIKISNESKCQIFNVTSLNDMMTVYNYTVSRYQSHIPKRTEGSASYQIGKMTQQLSSKFDELAMYWNTETNDNSCLFLDLNGKQILYDRCSRSPLKICMIDENPVADDDLPDAVIAVEKVLDAVDDVTNSSQNNSKELWPKYDNSEPSSFGLPNCYCSDCDTSSSVGKVYNDTCYFIATQYQFKANLRTRQNVINDKYRPVVISSDEEAIVFEQVSSEFNMQTLESSVAFFAEDTEKTAGVIRTKLNTKSSKCMIYDIRRGVFIRSCMFRYPIFLKTDTYYTLRPELEGNQYQQCSFDPGAVKMNGRSRTCIKISTTPCENSLARILSRNYDNVFRYLINQTQKEASTLQYLKSHFRVKTNSFNGNVLQFIQRSDTDKSCLYIDVQGKQIHWDACNLKTKYLCEIEQKSENISDLPSSPGLRDCICSTCNHYETVGKVFNGQCYFISTISQGRPVDVYDGLNGTSYKPAGIERVEEMRLIQQLSFEAKVNLGKDDIFFYTTSRKTATDLNKYIFPPPNGKSSHCVRFENSDDILIPYNIYDDCDSETNVILVENTTYQEYGPYVNTSKTECDFDANAVKTLKSWFCLKASDTTCDVKRTERVNFFHIVNTMQAGNMMAYLRDVSQGQAHSLGLLKSTYRVDNVNFKTMDGNCLYFDVQGKTTFLSSCDLNTSNLCLVSKYSNNKKTNIDINSSSSPVLNNTTLTTVNIAITTEKENDEEQNSVSIITILIAVTAVIVLPICFVCIVCIISKFCHICQRKDLFNVRYIKVND